MAYWIDLKFCAIFFFFFAKYWNFNVTCLNILKKEIEFWKAENQVWKITKKYIILFIWKY